MSLVSFDIEAREPNEMAYSSTLACCDINFMPKVLHLVPISAEDAVA